LQQAVAPQHILSTRKHVPKADEMHQKEANKQDNTTAAYTIQGSLILSWFSKAAAQQQKLEIQN